MAYPRKPPELKVITGSRRPSRPRLELPLVAAVPEPPDWLPNALAVQEWRRLAPILCANKMLTEAGLSALALLCALHGTIVRLWLAGLSPSTHLLAQLRHLQNDFALTPLSAGQLRPGEPASRSNPFRRNGKPR
jgi:hypothetical protein